MLYVRLFSKRLIKTTADIIIYLYNINTLNIFFLFPVFRMFAL